MGCVKKYVFMNIIWVVYIDILKYNLLIELVYFIFLLLGIVIYIVWNR